MLELFNSDGESIAVNDDWSGADISDTAATVGAFPLASGSKDAAILVKLAPGEYTAHATGKLSATGIALVEMYVVE